MYFRLLSLGIRGVLPKGGYFSVPRRGLSVVSSPQVAESLPSPVRQYVEERAKLCQPEAVHICDGSEEENGRLLDLMQREGVLHQLPKYKNCWLALTDPADVARVESKTFIVTESKRETTPNTAPGVDCQLARWMSPAQFDNEFNSRFPSCMKGRTMYVIPFSMGPVGSALSKIGVELTDSPYVVASMRVMTRIGEPVLQALSHQGGDNFVRALHSVGQPLPMDKPPINNWPCNPAKTIVAHIPSNNEICSYGSGYGGNSLLGKKCFALRLGSILARREGWLAEHMLILGITNPEGRKRYIAAAFPSACGKTNLAMMTPTLPGYKVECVGDDIAWMRFDDQGQLRAINPEAGFFGVAPGTSYDTNPKAMDTIQSNTVFTNVARTSDGGVWWEGIDKDALQPGVNVTSWTGEDNWQPGGSLAAHANSRFCTPASQCPVIDPAWEDPQGVPIDAIVFGGRRPQGVPLVYEARSWQHGVFVGAALRSEATAAAEHGGGKQIMHDPFAMRPFFGYNFGHYLSHWLSLERQGRQLPKVFHVNWFRKGADGQFMWPGFGENSRVLDWVLRRVEEEDCGVESPVGVLPKPGSIRLDGLKEEVDMEGLMNLPKDFWEGEVKAIETYFREQVGEDLPEGVRMELEGLRDRVQSM